MSFILINLNPYHAVAPYIVRIGEIITGASKGYPHFESDTNKWHLSSANTWWVRKSGENTLEIHWRLDDAHKMECLRCTLIWLLGLTDFN